jgi:hypothetical protein
MKTSTDLPVQASRGLMAGVATKRVQKAAVDVDRLVDMLVGREAGRPIASAIIAAIIIGCILIPAQKLGGVPIPAWGWLMLGLGIFFTLLVGCSLTALLFYSSRAGFDEPPEFVQKKIPSSRRRAPAMASSSLQNRQSKDKTDGRLRLSAKERQMSGNAESF